MISSNKTEYYNREVGSHWKYIAQEPLKRRE